MTTKQEERYILKVRFWSNTRHIKEEYLDVYEGILSEILSTTRFDENSDLSTTYLGKAERSKMIKLKQRSPSPYQNQGIPWENYLMEQNVKYC